MELKKQLRASFYANLFVASIGLFSILRAVFVEYGILSTIKTFTVLSNIYLTITAVMSAIFYLLSLRKNIDLTPRWMPFLKLTSNTTTTLTLLTVIFFLWPISGFDTEAMFGKACLFLHLLTPLAGLASYIFFEKKKNIKMPMPLLSLIPVILYATFYIIAVFSGGDANVLERDFYSFAHSPNVAHIDYIRSMISITAMLVGTFVISLVISILSNKFNSRKTS